MRLNFYVLEGVGLGMGVPGEPVSSVCGLCTALALSTGEII